MTEPERIETIAELRSRTDAARSDGEVVGFVPTMGFLHDGHASLMRAARRDADLVVASIFVNPLQFAAGEDLEAYPRDLDSDTAIASRAGVDLLFVPAGPEMYPRPIDTTVAVGRVSQGFEGASRPSHFAGVATVVAKLFSIVGPCRAHFGEKDWQQLAVIRRMVDDLSMPVAVIGEPTVREPDGLAMSSRNAYLTAPERAVAPVVHRALQAGAGAVLDGVTDPAAVRSVMSEIVAAEPLADLDYVAAVDAADLTEPDRLEGELRLLAAVRFGKARLIDNLGVTVPDGMHRNRK